MNLKIIWQGKLTKEQKQLIEKDFKKVLSKRNLSQKIEVAVNVISDSQMVKLNRQYMGKRGSTDVLSFPLEKEMGPDKVIRLGDIVLNIKFKNRFEFLTQHGLLHLLGEHHD